MLHLHKVPDYGGGKYLFGTSAYHFTRACSYMRGIRLYKRLIEVSEEHGNYLDAARHLRAIEDHRKEISFDLREAWELRTKERRQLPVVVA